MHHRVPRAVLRTAATGALAAAGLLSVPIAACADTVGSVAVHITQKGAAASGTRVVLSGADGVTRSVTTDARGDATFARVPFGHYTIEAGPQRRGIDVATDSVQRVAIDTGLETIANAAVSQARGPGGEPVSVNALDRAQIAALPQNQSLNRIVDTLPGIVRFSYDEPVAHGFHGLTYELDGVPLPQGTTSNFGEIIDPRTIDSLEVFTGAFPAEFGGSRQGAVVNLVSHGASNAPIPPDAGRFTVGAGTYGGAQTSFSDRIQAGPGQLDLSANLERTSRGIDTPTFVPDHDDASRANGFVRFTTPLGSNNSLAVDLANENDTFEVPISTGFNPNDPVRDAPGTDDVQTEQNRFASVSFTHEARDGSGYVRIAPWTRADRVAYLGDLGADLRGTATDPDSGDVTTLDGLREDRRSAFLGVRADALRQIGHNAVKAGIDVSQENFHGTTTIAQTGVADFNDDEARRGTQSAAYVEDTFAPTAYVTLKGGLRFDRSTGFVDGGQISPRFELDFATGPRDVLHAYYGRMYAAPFIEDTRREAVVTSGDADGTLPTYDLRPERDSYYEFGLAHTLAPNARAYVNFWKRDATNVLDTTQIFPTPVFAVFNNAVGVAKGVEGRVESRWQNGDSFSLSSSLSSSLAGGISGGTFLFGPDDLSNTSLQPEDHDQTFTTTIDYTKRFGGGRTFYASLSPQYGTGFPVEFESGPSRLPPHLTFDASVGRDPTKATPGFTATFENFTNAVYLIKIDNGFNTTQYGPGARYTLRFTQPF